MLMILTTHPIQYQIPLWKEITNLTNKKVIVYYITKHGINESFDSEFKLKYKWDIDILGGYKYKFAENAKENVKGFFSHYVSSPTKLLNFIDYHKISIIIINGWNVVFYIQAIILLKIMRPKIKLILRCEANDLGKRNIYFKFFRFIITKLIVKRFDYYLSIGKPNTRFYLTRGVDKKNIFNTPYSVDNDGIKLRHSEKKSLNREYFRSKYSIDKNAIVFLFCGKFIPKKNPIDLVNALNLFKKLNPDINIHLLLVGDGELKNQLRNITNVSHSPRKESFNKTNLKINSTFTGFLNQSEITEAYAASDFIVLPSSHKETWGLVINEAMLFDVVPIVSDECGCSEDLVKPLSEKLIFRKGDIEDMYRSLKFAVSNPDLRKDIKKIIDKFSIKQNAEIIKEIIAINE